MKALARMTYFEAFEQGIELIFGFPNKNSYPGFVKLGWTFRENMQNFTIKGGLPLCELAGKYPIFETLYRDLIPKERIYKGKFYFHLKVENHLMIGDVAKFRIWQTLDFIQEVQQAARKYLAGKALISVSENHWLYPCLKEHLTPTEGLPIGFYPLKDNVPTDYSFTLGDTDTFI